MRLHNHRLSAPTRGAPRNLQPRSRSNRLHPHAEIKSPCLNLRGSDHATRWSASECWTSERFEDTRRHGAEQEAVALSAGSHAERGDRHGASHLCRNRSRTLCASQSVARTLPRGGSLSTSDRGKTDWPVEFLRGRIDVAAPSSFGAPLWNAPAHDAPRPSTCRCSHPSAPPSVTAPSDAARRTRMTDIASACGCAAPGYSHRETECRGSLKPVAERGETERAPKFSQDQIKHSIRAMWPGPLDIYSPCLGNRHGPTLSTLTQENALTCVSRARAREGFELFLSLFMPCRLASRFPARRPRLRGRPGSDSPARLNPCDLIDGNRSGTSPVNFAPKKLFAGVTADADNVTVNKYRGSTSVFLAGAQISTPPRTA